MSEHFTRNTETALGWCDRCGRVTEHQVSGGKVSHCKECEKPFESKSQIKRRQARERDARNPRLF